MTSGIGMDIRFRYQDRDYSAKEGNWVIKKTGKEEIYIKVSWDDKAGFNQLWKIKLQEDNIIFWDVEMYNDNEVKIRNKEAELILNKRYNKWLTSEENGDFKNLERKGSVILNKYINNFLGAQSIYDKDNISLPEVAFECENSAPTVSYIIKSGKQEADILRYVEIDFDDKCDLPQGKCGFFKGQIKFANKSEENAAPVAVNAPAKPSISHKINFGRISVVFENGKGRLFWGKHELTNGLGIYYSVYSKDNWYDSSQAYWKLQESDGKKLIFVGRWAWLPIVQVWEIGLLDEMNILWKVTNRVWDNIVTEREQVSVMLSAAYKNWFVSKRAEGRFPEKFREHDGIFWDRFWCGEIDAPVGIKKQKIKSGILNRKHIPGLMLECADNCCGRYLIIENTDVLFKSRILQCEIDSNSRNKSKQSNYFEGKIKLIV